MVWWSATSRRAAPPRPARRPSSPATRPAVHADHLGASTYIEKGWSLISLGDYAGAIQALDKALTLSPGAVQAQSLLGWAQMLHEDYDEALGNFSKVLMKEPANALARINVGYICLKKGIFGEAIEHLSKAIRLDNDRKATLYAHYYLGLVYLEREMYEDAQTFLRKTLKLGPNLIEAYFELGRALWLGGEREEAVQVWTDGYKANKFNPWAKRCQEMLEVASAGGEVPRSPLSNTLVLVCSSCCGHGARALQGGHGRAGRPGDRGRLAGAAYPCPRSRPARGGARRMAWPGRRTPGPLQLILVPDGRRLDSLSTGRAPLGSRVALPGARTILLRADRDDSTAPSATSWPTWPSTRRCRDGCRSGSMRAMPRGPPGNGTARRARSQSGRGARCGARSRGLDGALRGSANTRRRRLRSGDVGGYRVGAPESDRDPDAAAPIGWRRATTSRPRFG